MKSKYSLACILSVGLAAGCVSDPYSSTTYVRNIESLTAVQLTASPPTPAPRRYLLDKTVLEDTEKAQLGPLEVSTNSDHNALRLGIRGLDAYVEFPVRDQHSSVFRSDYNNFSRYRESEPADPFDYTNEPIPLPAEEALKFGRDFLIDNVPWLKDASKVVSGAANTPVKYALGDSHDLLFNLNCADGDITRIQSVLIGTKWTELEYGENRKKWEVGLEIEKDELTGKTRIMPFFGVRF